MTPIDHDIRSASQEPPNLRPDHSSVLASLSTNSRLSKAHTDGEEGEGPEEEDEGEDEQSSQDDEG